MDRNSVAQRTLQMNSRWSYHNTDMSLARLTPSFFYIEMVQLCLQTTTMQQKTDSFSAFSDMSA